MASFSPNSYGLHDMAGGLWEWCWDRYSVSYYGTSPGTDPHGSTSTTFRVFRGAVWSFGADSRRVANREGNNPGGSAEYLGFRTARSATP